MKPLFLLLLFAMNAAFAIAGSASPAGTNLILFGRGLYPVMPQLLNR